MLILLSIFSPIAELFPNMYMSWWTPDNEKMEAYLKAWWRRVFIVLLVWVPILITLGAVTSTAIQLFITLLVFSAFGLRLYFFDTAMHKSIVEKTEFVEPTKIPEIIYFIAFSTIGWVIYHAVPDYQWLIPLAIFIIYLGAFMMATFRWGDKKNFTLDIVGRIVFTFGFLLNLYNLSRAASII